MAWMTVIGLNWIGGSLTHPMDIVDVPQKPGVFKLHARQADQWGVIYVGQSDNLYLTLLSILGTIPDGGEKFSRVSDCIQEYEGRALSYSYAELTDPQERLGCVRSLYHFFHPTCNQPDELPTITHIACNPY